MGQYEKAELYFQQAITAENNSLFFPNPNNMVYFWINQALHYMRKGEYLKAGEYLTMSEDILKTASLPKKLKIYHLRVLGVLSINTNEHKIARNHFLEARKIYLNNNYPRDQIYLLIIDRLVVTEINLGQFQQVDLFLKEQQNLIVKLLGKEHIHYALNLKAQALLASSQNQVGKSLDLYEESISLVEMYNSDDAKNYFELIVKIAEITTAQDGHLGTENIYSRGLQFLKGRQPDIYYINLSIIYGAYLETQKENDKALKHWQQLETFTRSKNGEKHFYNIAASFLLGLFEVKIGKINIGENRLLKVKEIVLKEHSQNSQKKEILDKINVILGTNSAGNQTTDKYDKLSVMNGKEKGKKIAETKEKQSQ